MKRARITAGGQVSVPAAVRRRWKTTSVAIDDLGDRLIIRPLPDDPISNLRGAFRGLTDSTRARAVMRADEEAAERRRR